jgi:hypothetical protein
MRERERDVKQSKERMENTEKRKEKREKSISGNRKVNVRGWN